MNKLPLYWQMKCPWSTDTPFILYAYKYQTRNVWENETLHCIYIQTSYGERKTWMFHNNPMNDLGSLRPTTFLKVRGVDYAL